MGSGSFPAVKTLPQSKYSSIQNLQKDQKVQALKDPKLNPLLIKDGYDSLAHAYWLWTQVAGKAVGNSKITGDQQEKLASNYYDHVIAPAYGQLYKEKNLGSNSPLPKDLWMKQAYGEALNYNIEDAYNNDWIHGLENGWHSGLAATARAANTVSTMLGNGLTDAISAWRREQVTSGLDKTYLAEEQARTNRDWKALAVAKNDRQAWYHKLGQINQNEIDSKNKPNMIARGAVYQDAHHQFWADALPTHGGFANKATSFIAEQAGQLPVYASLMLGGEALGAAGGSTLTARLSTNAIGKHTIGLLLAGTEGAAYGAAIRKQDDPGEIYRDAIGFAVFHGMFDIGGMGLKKLVDVLPSDSHLMEELRKRKDARDAVRDGMRLATPVERYEDHTKDVANNLAATGVLGQRAIYIDALHHIHETENMPHADLKALEGKYLEEDPARWAPVLSSAKFVRALLGEQKISDLKSGSPEEEYLSSRMAQLITDGASKINTAVKGMDQAREIEAQKNLAAPSAKHTLEFYVEQAKAEIAKTPGAAGLVSNESILKAAQKKYAADLAKAAEIAEKETGPSPAEEATNISKRSTPTKPALKIRSERTVNQLGEPAVRYSVNPDYVVRLNSHKAAAKAARKSLKEWFQDLSDEDFEHDLSSYFYPKALKQAKIFFEHQNTREGMQNPNFLAFMYNYTSQMPREFSQELENRLIDTMKVQKYMNGKTATQAQLLYYGKSIHNHIDNFLGSGRWPKEHNIFRTSNQDMLKTTKWQKQLLLEKTLQEQKNLRDAFSGQPKAKRLALATHMAFSKLRFQEFNKASMERNSQDIIKGYDKIISDLITSTKKYKKWEF